MSSSDPNDYRHFAARYRPRGRSFRQRLMLGENLRQMRINTLTEMALHIGDLVAYDFGGKTLLLKVSEIDGFRIRTHVLGEETRVFRFGGLDSHAPGVWEGDRPSVSALLYRPKETPSAS